MKRDNIFIKIKNSIYNLRKISIYSRDGLGRAILYVLLLSIFLGLGKAIVLGVNIDKTFNTISDLLKDEKYKFNISNGELDIRTSPIKEDSSGVLIYVNDEIKLQDVSELKSIIVNSDVYIAILKDGIEVGSNSPDYKLNPTRLVYSEFNLEGISNNELISSMKVNELFLIIGVIFSSVALTFIYYLMDAIIVTVFAMVPNILFKTNLRYSKLYFIVLYAATLPNLLIFIFNILAPNVYFSNVCKLGTLLYTILILKDIKKHSINKVI